MIKVEPICALRDNYIWLIIAPEQRQVLVVDPGEAAPVIAFLQQQALQLLGILVTHHHWDHTQGIDQLLAYQTAPVYAGMTEPVAQCSHPVSPNELLYWPTIDLRLQVLAIPGHTLGHVAYYNPQGLGVFTGDTLFAAGCGRLFEGTAAQMYTSLQTLAALPPSTPVYCGHEYTLANLQFAQQVEPANLAIQQRLHRVSAQRQQQTVTLPSTIDWEQQTNPFLRCHIPALQQAVNHHTGTQTADPITIFANLRDWKNSF